MRRRRNTASATKVNSIAEKLRILSWEIWDVFFFVSVQSICLQRRCVIVQRNQEPEREWYSIILERILFADFMRICRKNSCPHGKGKKMQHKMENIWTVHCIRSIYIELNRVAENQRILFRFIYFIRQCTCPVVHIIFSTFRSV